VHPANAVELGLSGGGAPSSDRIAGSNVASGSYSPVSGGFGNVPDTNHQTLP